MLYGQFKNMFVCHVIDQSGIFYFLFMFTRLFIYIYLDSALKLSPIMLVFNHAVVVLKPLYRCDLSPGYLTYIVTRLHQNSTGLISLQYRRHS